MFTLRIASIRHSDVDKTVSVTVNILKSNKVVETRILGFDNKIPEKELRNQLKRYIRTFNSDHEQALRSAKQDRENEEIQENVDKLKVSLEGQTIK